MKITWNDISTHLVYSKLTGTEPNRVYKEIYDFLQHWIPSIIQDTKVTINDKYSYYYDSKTKCLWIDYDNIWSVFQSKYGAEYSDIESLIIGYAISTHNMVVKDTMFGSILVNLLAVSTHNMVVKDTF
jgi:hypothetical protein